MVTDTRAPLFLFLIVCGWLAQLVLSQNGNVGFVGLDSNENILVAAPVGCNVSINGNSVFTNGADLTAALRTLATLAQEVSTLKVANTEKDAQLSSMVAQQARTNNTLQQLQLNLASVSSTAFLSMQSYIFSRDYIFLRSPPRLLADYGTDVGQIAFVSGVAEADNSYFVADSQNGLSRFFFDGRAPLTVFNGTMLQKPYGLVFYDNSLFTLENGNSLLKRLDPFNSTTIWATSTNTIYSGGGTTARFNNPWDLVVLPNNRIVVSDCDNNRLVYLNATNGAPLSSPFSLNFGSFIAIPSPSLNRPRGLAFDSSNWALYVVDSNNNRVLEVAIHQLNFIGLVTRIFPISTSAQTIAGIAFSPITRTLFVGDTSTSFTPRRMHTINLTDSSVSILACALPVPCVRPFLRTLGGYGLYVSAGVTSPNLNSNALYMF